jgi:hypothetical protein
MWMVQKSLLDVMTSVAYQIMWWWYVPGSIFAMDLFGDVSKIMWYWFICVSIEQLWLIQIWIGHDVSHDLD